MRPPEIPRRGCALRGCCRLAILSLMFSDAVLDHFKNPRNAGELPGATSKVEVSNPVCGDVLQLAVHIENERVADARFLCRGCTTSIACASLLTEQLRGRTLGVRRARLCLPARATILRRAMQEKSEGGPGVLGIRVKQSSRTSLRRTARSSSSLGRR